MGVILVNSFMPHMKIFIVIVSIITTVLTAVLDKSTQYDSVWLASIDEFPDVGSQSSNNVLKFFFHNFSNVDVEFRLYTRKNARTYQILEIGNSTLLQESSFDKTCPVKIVVHGWSNNGSSPMPMNIRDAYLNVSNLNIIVVDWNYAANVNYVSSSYYVAHVGNQVTNFLNFLIDEGVKQDDVHMIGHSLGAHVVGIAGAHVEKGPIHTITGLDPAKPLFSERNTDARLDKHDAKYVEVIHTCGGYIGFAVPIGHVDFYPNGGSRQPGCGVDFRGYCAHDRSYEYFAESIYLDIDFVATQCESYYNIAAGCCIPTGKTLNMGGYPSNYGEEGVYYLTTNSESPYAKGSKRKKPVFQWRHNSKLMSRF